MMRRFATRVLLALLLPCLPFAAAAQQQAAIPAFDSPVVDTTGTLDAASKQQLEQQALALQQRKGSQLQVLVIPSTRPECSMSSSTSRVSVSWKPASSSRAVSAAIAACNSARSAVLSGVSA